MSTLTKLPPTVWLLGLVSLFNDSASELLYPLIPLYLASVLMAGPRALGLIEGIAEATSSLLKLFSGVLVDRTRSAKPWVVAGYSLAALARPMMAVASSWPGMLALRFADRVGKGLRTSPRDALLAMSAPPELRGVAFGLHRAMDNAGAVIGPLAAAWLLAAQAPLRDIFLWTILPGLFAVICASLIREPQHEKPVNPPAFDWTLQGFPLRYKRYLLTLALFTLGNSSNMFLLLRAHDMGLPDTMVPLLWGLTSGMAMLFSTPLSALSDRYGRSRLIVSGWAVYGLFYLLLGLNNVHTWTLWLLFACYGLFLAATEGAEKAMVADIAPRKSLGTAYGWFNLVGGIMLLPASFIFGWLWQAFNPLTAFCFSATCALTASLLLKFWGGQDEER